MRFSLNQMMPYEDKFVFGSLGDIKKKDAIVIHNPSHAICEFPVLLRSSKTLEEHISYIAEQHINKAIVVAEDISFLPSCPSLERLYIIPAQTVRGVDHSPLYSMPLIRWLECELSSITNTSLSLDLGRIHGLERLGLSGWHSKINVHSAINLKSLYLHDGQQKEKDLSVLRPKCTLQNLVIINSNIASLAGIEAAKELKRIELHYNRNLQDIGDLSAVSRTLVWLDINNCNRIADFSVLSELHNLELLRLSGTKGVPSLEFIKEMPNLKFLVIMIDVFDGNMSFCENIPYVAIKNRRHFSHKDKDFSKKSDGFPKFIENYE